VKTKFEELNDAHIDCVISESHVRRLISKLRLGCAAGADGISAEHLRYATDSSLPLHLSMMLSGCLRFGCLPVAFRLGLLVPILKKSHLNPKDPSNYRPITISSIVSKLLELYVTEKADKRFHPMQFGFIANRSTSTAISLAHDVSQYCSSRGSAVYMCSLDAEGAFDAIPFPVLFLKAASRLPDVCWRLMYSWYSNLHVQIKWQGALSSPIPVLKGTRQGGLSSPMLFNLFYQDLIETLNSEECGIAIKGRKYNAFCYADDVLLASTTQSGLQKLINASVDYISNHGLRFNPAKTNCFYFGRTRHLVPPIWRIEGEELNHVDSLLYLGATLKDDGGLSHATTRINAAQKAFYGLQGAGLCFRGVSPEVSAHMYAVGVRSVLTYGCEAVRISNATLKKLESTQGKLVKAFLGLRKTSHTSPLIQALHIPPVAISIGLASLNLLRSSLLHSSSASHFYSHLLAHVSSSGFSAIDSLVNRSSLFAFTHGININNFIFNDTYRSLCKKRFKYFDTNGLVDTISFLFDDYGCDARNLVQSLVNPF